MKQKKLSTTRKIIFALSFVALVSAGLIGVDRVKAQAFFGAIYDTDVTSVPVNQNIFTNKEDVYLNGGPQNDNANGLPVGVYFFQVTDPSGATLLSTSPAVCRQLEVKDVDGKGRVSGIWDGRPDFCDGLHPNGENNISNGSIAVKLMPFDDTPNNGGVYKVWLIRQGGRTEIVGNQDTSPVLSFQNSDAKTDNFKVLEDDPPPPDDVYTLRGCKFYDANANGIWDAGEDTIPGFRILVTIDGIDEEPLYTDVTGCWEIEGVAKGSEYFVEEELPLGKWYQTYPEEIEIPDPNGGAGDTLLIRAHSGFAVGGVCGEGVCVIDDLDFGNYCTRQGSGGFTLGYWSNRNGQGAMNAYGMPTLLYGLSALNLRDGKGDHFDPTTYTEFRTWLLGGTSTNMAYMLSVQMAATYLNVTVKDLDGNAVVLVNGETGTLNDWISDANASLGLNGDTPAGHAERSNQERLKNIFDSVNNNIFEVINPTPCAVEYPIDD